MKKLTAVQKTVLKKVLLKKDGSVSAVGGKVLEIVSMLATGGVYHHTRYAGTGRHARIVREAVSHDVYETVRRIGWKIEEGNDAERGGAHGDFYKLARKVNFVPSELLAQIQ